MEQIRRRFTLKELSMDRPSKSRALAWLANAELILIQSAPGRSPIIAILPVEEAEACTLLT